MFENSHMDAITKLPPNQLVCVMFGVLRRAMHVKTGQRLRYYNVDGVIVKDKPGLICVTENLPFAMVGTFRVIA